MTVQEAAGYLRARVSVWPETAIVLGSAQSSFASELDSQVAIDYKGIPGWPVPSVEGHSGQIVIGSVDGVPVTVLGGRVHLYEGWTPRQVTYGLRALGLLGLRRVILTNAAGGINPAYHRGQLVLITDHINLQGVNPLVGPNDDALGPRFPDMSHAYCPELCAKAKVAAAAGGVELGEGVYAGLLGPSFETPAEIRYLRAIGADLAGMSTVAETIVANHMGIKVLGISTVTNMAAGMQAELSHQEVLETGRAASAALARLLRALLPALNSANTD
jgi:purine-nucleoside phosphorylase